MDAIRLLEQSNVKVYKNVKETGRKLGIGSYGTVVELRIQRAGKFAGKKLHEALIAPGDASHLVKECQLMSQLDHPNIAKFCGVCKLPTSTVPALVMELMDYNLENVIENSADFSLAMDRALSILIDVANGLTYLHSRDPQVLHRDLTARNVLLDKSMNAKITDFGNSRFVDATMLSKTMTHYPGTLVYMPPEALESHSRYSDRLDTFSFGHLALYTLIREFPKDLLPATYSATNGHLKARTELERRSHYMEKLNKVLPAADHHLYRLTQECFQNDPTKRPSSIELLHRLQDILKLEQVEGAYVELTQSDREGATKLGRALPAQETDLERSSGIHEYKGPTKIGLIEKKSGGLKGGWRAYTFTLNYREGTFKYARAGPFAKSPTIRLDDIKDIKNLKQDGSRFPFEIHFSGRNSPWELCVYSEADRRDWREALLAHPKKDAANFQSASERVTDEELFVYEDLEMYKELPQPSKEPLYDEPIVSTRPSLSIATNVPGSSADHSDDDVYEKILYILKEKFDPSQMDAIAQMLQSTKLSVYQERTPPVKSSTPIPPQIPPPLHPPPPPLDIDIYPELEEESNGEEEHRKPEPKQYTNIPDSKPKTCPPVPPKPKGWRELRPSRNREDMQSLSKLIRDKDTIANEKLLVTGAAHDETHRPTWATASSLPTPLEVLRKEALSIPPSSLSNISKIGEGKFGMVYRAQMRDMTVAIKVTKKYSDKAMSDFQNEMSIMSEVSHHNIVRLYGIINEGPLSPALVMEYLPHGNLQMFLREEKQPNESLLKYMTDVAMGMHYLCERGLIHRDLAARNVLVDENQTCKVSDFGLLREVPKEISVYISQYQGPSPLRWMAPESITERVFSPATDVWSYGILQWEMFFPEKIPYQNMEDMQMVTKVCNGFRMPIPRGCPGLAAKIMRACWQQDPENRPSFLLISNLLAQRYLPQTK